MARAGQAPAIVSASLNADVPALHGRWFMGRLAAGFCRIGRRDGIHFRRVSLARDAVAGLVFWTRNIAPFRSALVELKRLGYPCVVQFAITADRHTQPTATDAVQDLAGVARELGPRAVVWRYDPIVASRSTPLDWHLANLAALAKRMAGATDEVCIAFARHRKPPREGDAALDPAEDAKRAFVRDAAVAARQHGMRLTLCSQPDWLARGASPARCIDVRRLADVGANDLDAGSAGFVPGCLCARAVDLGDSDGAAPQFAGALPRRARHAAADEHREILLPPRRTFVPMRGELPF